MFNGANSAATANEGDRGFLGVVTRIDPANLNQGYLAESHNLRYNKRTIGTRPAIVYDERSRDIQGELLYLSFTLPANLGISFPLLAAQYLYFDSAWSLVLLTANSIYIEGEVHTLADPLPKDARPTILAANNKIYIISDQDTQEFDGDSVSATSIGAASHALYAVGRMVRVKSDYEVAFSNIFSVGSGFETENTVINVGFGDGDPIVAISKWALDQLVVFKTNSIHLITSISNPATSEVEQITAQHGLLARECVIQVGKEIYYLAENGLHSLTTTIHAEKELSPSHLPLTDPIQNEFEKYDSEVAKTTAMGCYLDNRLYLALPSKGSTRNDHIWVYNFLNQAWESRDTMPGDGRAPDYLFSGDQVYMLDQFGEMYYYDESSRFDQVNDGNGGVVVTSVEGQAVLRQYALGIMDIKQWQTLEIDWEAKAWTETGVNWIRTEFQELENQAPTHSTYVEYQGAVVNEYTTTHNDGEEDEWEEAGISMPFVVTAEGSLYNFDRIPIAPGETFELQGFSEEMDGTYTMVDPSTVTAESTGVAYVYDQLFINFPGKSVDRLDVLQGELTHEGYIRKKTFTNTVIDLADNPTLTEGQEIQLYGFSGNLDGVWEVKTGNESDYPHEDGFAHWTGSARSDGSELILYGADARPELTKGKVNLGAKASLSYTTHASNPDSTLPVRSVLLTQAEDVATRTSLGRQRGKTIQPDLTITGHVEVQRVEVTAALDPTQRTHSIQ